MEEKKSIVKKIILVSILLIMLLPLIQRKLNLISVLPLNGAIEAIENPKISLKDWFNGEYQQKKEIHLNSDFGFRNTCVRLHHQIQFDLYNKILAEDVVVGKKHYLFEQNYINAYTGADYLGADSIKHIVRSLQFISDTLSKKGKHLLLVFAAGKASYYPEYLPEGSNEEGINTNYKQYIKELKKTNLSYIDFNDYFISQKNKSKYPLYSQFGIHWSRYGAYIAADSIIKKIEQLQNITMLHLSYDTVMMNQPTDIDYDLASGMNLLRKLKSFNMAYPKIYTKENSNAIKPKVLVVSDSYYWDMYRFGIINSFSSQHFWYYNEAVYPESDVKKVFVNQLKLLNEINKHDIVIIMSTEANLRKYGWGFINAMELLFLNAKERERRMNLYHKKINQVTILIKKDPKWMVRVAEKAKHKNITLDSMLVIESLWQIENGFNEN